MAISHQVRMVFGVLGVALSGMVLEAAAQQDYLVKAIRIIVPSGAGGGTDGTTRVVAPKLDEFLGQRVIVENRPGAGPIVGSEARQDASVRERLLASGADPVGNSPEEFASLVRAEVAKWAKVVQAAGIKPE